MAISGTNQKKTHNWISSKVRYLLEWWCESARSSSMLYYNHIIRMLVYLSLSAARQAYVSAIMNMNILTRTDRANFVVVWLNSSSHSSSTVKLTLVFMQNFPTGVFSKFRPVHNSSTGHIKTLLVNHIPTKIMMITWSRLALSTKSPDAFLT